MTMHEQQPQAPTMQGYVMRIVLQILAQIEKLAEQYYMDVKTANGIVRAGGHTITDARTTIKRLIGMGYNIQKEWRTNQFGDRYKVYWLEECQPQQRQLTIFDILPS